MGSIQVDGALGVVLGVLEGVSVGLVVEDVQLKSHSQVRNDDTLYVNEEGAVQSTPTDVELHIQKYSGHRGCSG